MTADYPEEMGGFKVLLYGLFHINNLKDHPPFGPQEAARALRDYGEDRFQIIIKGLKWAVKNRDVDYKNIFPGMKYSNDEILWYFDKTLREMVDAGICREE